jgi:hypothetical protein
VLLRAHGLMEDARFRYLAASCLAEVGEWEEVLALLADSEPDDLAASQVGPAGLGEASSWSVGGGGEGGGNSSWQWG